MDQSKETRTNLGMSPGTVPTASQIHIPTQELHPGLLWHKGERRASSSWHWHGWTCSRAAESEVSMAVGQ